MARDVSISIFKVNLPMLHTHRAPFRVPSPIWIRLWTIVISPRIRYVLSTDDVYTQKLIMRSMCATVWKYYASVLVLTMAIA